MNQFFETQRWLLLMRKHWGEHRKIMILSLISIASVLMIWYLLELLITNFRPVDEFVQTATYYFGLVLIGCLYASMLFADLASRPKGINFLLVPASRFEKLLCAFIFGVVFFFVAYTVIFYIVDIPAVKLANSIRESRAIDPKLNSFDIVPQRVVNVFRGPSNHSFADVHQCYYFLLAFFALQSAFALGSVYAPKFSFIKTSIMLLFLLVFSILLIARILPPLMPEGYFYENITTYRLTGAGTGENAIQLPHWVHDIVIFLFQFGFAPLFWITAYFRLKEKQL